VTAVSSVESRLVDSMNGSSLHRKIISGHGGVWAWPVRAGLRLLEGAYSTCVQIRNRHFDREGASVVVPIPVISVGNITAGGTGKTPLVMEVVRRLEAMGLSPAVVARGYKSASGEPNDEQRLVLKSCPGVGYVADPDRVRAAQFARLRCGADVIVLDDGFQHRRISRGLDIVLIDAMCPFGFDHLLPRGLLREPLEALRRADVIVVSRVDQVSASEISVIDNRLRHLTGDTILIKSRHRVIAVEHLDGPPVGEKIEGKRAVVFAGIGNPSAFRTTVRMLGVEIVGEKWWPDHHHYRRRDIDTLIATGRFAPHDMLLTTEKDAVKLAELGGLDHARIGVVRIAVDFLDDGGTMLQKALERLIQSDDTP